MNVGLDIENLFDQDIITRSFATRYRDSFNVSDQAFFSGTFDPLAIAASTPTIRPDPRFGLADQYLSRRRMRLQVRYAF